MDNNIKHEKKQTIGYRQREFSAYIQPNDRSEWPVFQASSGFDTPDDFLRHVRREDNQRVSHPKFSPQPYWVRKNPSEYGSMTKKQRNTDSIVYQTTRRK